MAADRRSLPCRLGILNVYYGLAEIQTRIHTNDFATGRRIVHAIGEAAQGIDHHVDLDLRAARVDVRLTSGCEIDGVTEDRSAACARAMIETCGCGGEGRTFPKNDLRYLLDQGQRWRAGSGRYARVQGSR